MRPLPFRRSAEPGRLALRVAVLASPAILAACSDADIQKSVDNAVKKTLWYFVKILLIAVGVMVAWAAMVVAGLVLAAVGARRRRVDGPAAALIGGGAAITMLAWPLTFSSWGLLGALAPESGVKPQALPVVLHGVGVAVVVAVVRAFSQRKSRRAAPAMASLPPAPMSPPPRLPGMDSLGPLTSTPGSARGLRGLPPAAEPPLTVSRNSSGTSKPSRAAGSRKPSARGTARQSVPVVKRRPVTGKPAASSKRPVRKKAPRKQPVRAGSKRRD